MTREGQGDEAREGQGDEAKEGQGDEAKEGQGEGASFLFRHSRESGNPSSPMRERKMAPALGGGVTPRPRGCGGGLNMVLIRDY
jgi:hypothetical protein